MTVMRVPFLPSMTSIGPEDGAHVEVVVLRVDLRFDARAPARAVVSVLVGAVDVVVHVHLAETHARRALADAVEQVVMQRHAQVFTVLCRAIGITDEHGLVV